MLSFATSRLCSTACHLCFQVSTAGQHSKKPSTLLSCSRKFLNLPDQVSAIHIEFTEYYFPDNQDFPGNTPRLAPSFISSFKNQCFNSLGVLTVLKLLWMSLSIQFPDVCLSKLLLRKWCRVYLVQNVEEMLYSKNNEPKSTLKDLLWLKLGVLGPQGALSALQLPWWESWNSSLLCCFSQLFSFTTRSVLRWMVKPCALVF